MEHDWYFISPGYEIDGGFACDFYRCANCDAHKGEWDGKIVELYDCDGYVISLFDKCEELVMKQIMK